jgi:hypothetical protein
VAWSKHQLARAARRGPVVINDVIYAEISVQFTSLRRYRHYFPTVELIAPAFS